MGGPVSRRAVLRSGLALAGLSPLAAPGSADRLSVPLAGEGDDERGTIQDVWVVNPRDERSDGYYDGFDLAVHANTGFEWVAVRPAPFFEVRVEGETVERTGTVPMDAELQYEIQIADADLQQFRHDERREVAVTVDLRERARFLAEFRYDDLTRTLPLAPA